MGGHSAWIAAFGRVLIAAIFLYSGFGKIMAPEGTQAYIASAGLPLPIAGYVLAIIVEVGGGLLLLIGYQTRLVALIIALYSIVAALAFHNQFADQNQLIHFMKNFCIAGGLLQIVAFGAGSMSVDARRAAR
jgi:putative oxidoreductase